jgi:predicted acylesterase/phospholipase RssA
MTIKNIVLPGGGALGIQFLGALEKLEMENFWKRDEIESIYGTSVGAIIGTFICLKYDWETLNKYIIERPWHESIKINPNQLLNLYDKKGIFDGDFFKVIFKSLLEAKDLSINISLKELYEFSNIDLHIFTFNLNKFETIDLSHNTHPHLKLLDALHMSSAIPGLFVPFFDNDICYIDGGIKHNLPLNFCLNDHPNKDETLAINFLHKTEDGNPLKTQVKPNSSLFDFISVFTINTIRYIGDSIEKQEIENKVICYIDENPLSLEFFMEVFKSYELRKSLLEKGHQDALVLLAKKKL